MAETPESEIVREFRKRIQRGQLGSLRLTYRVPAEARGHAHGTQELRLAGTRAVEVEAEGDEPAERRRVTAQEEEEELRALYESAAETADELIPRSQARFLPDSAVGMVRLEVAGKHAELFFLTDEGQREQQNARLSSEAVRSLARLSAAQQRLLRGGRSRGSR
jgi:hypothetical protein